MAALEEWWWCCNGSGRDVVEVGEVGDGGGGGSSGRMLISGPSDDMDGEGVRR